MTLPEGEVCEETPEAYLFKDGDTSLDAPGLPRAKEFLVEACATEPLVVECQGKRFWVEPLSSEGTVYIFGAGHIGRKLAQLTSFVGFRTVLLDDREDVARQVPLGPSERIVVLRSFDEAMKDLDIDKESYLVIVTRGHIHDKTVLAQALRTQALYVGMIGSRKKREATYLALTNEGFSSQDFSRVHCPIGLSIGAQTPEEIAVCIVAELIQKRSEQTR
jgi:xanthine dehydrogenase accessory factor